jgi:hypothetical protein
MRVGTKAWAEAECGIHMYRRSVVGRKDPCPWCADVHAEIREAQPFVATTWAKKRGHKQGKRPHVQTQAERNYTRGGPMPAPMGE